MENEFLFSLFGGSFKGFVNHLFDLVIGVCRWNFFFRFF